MKYYIAENGQQAGPFEPSELLLHGLTVNSLVWCEGMPNWTSASQVPELMALLSGQTFNPGNIDTQLPQMPPIGGNQPQVPPFQPTQPTTYGQGTPNQPYAPPQYGPSIYSIFKAYSSKNKFMAGDSMGSEKDASTAKKWMIITIIIGVVWTCIQTFRLLSNPELLQNIQEGAFGNLYGM